MDIGLFFWYILRSGHITPERKDSMAGTTRFDQEGANGRAECVVVRNPRGLNGEAFTEVARKFSIPSMEATLEQLFRELEDGSLRRGDWRAGEVEITGIVGMVANRFWVEVEYAVLFPPKKVGNEPVAGSYRMIVWTSGVAAGAGALMFTPSWEVLLVRQFRHATRNWEIELPRGARLPGESVQECALREGQKEVGGIPTEASRIEEVGSTNPDTGILRVNVGLVIVTNVAINEAAQNRDVSESHLGTIKYTIPNFLGMIDRGEITCAITLAAFAKAVARGIIPTHLLAA